MDGGGGVRVRGHLLEECGHGGGGGGRDTMRANNEGKAIACEWNRRRRYTRTAQHKAHGGAWHGTRYTVHGTRYTVAHLVRAKGDRRSLGRVRRKLGEGLDARARQLYRGLLRLRRIRRHEVVAVRETHQLLNQTGKREVSGRNTTHMANKRHYLSCACTCPSLCVISDGYGSSTSVKTASTFNVGVASFTCTAYTV